MRKLLLCIIMSIFLIGMASAMEWDNTKVYDPATEKIVFKDTFLHLFPTSDIATAQLITPHKNYVMPGENRLVAKITIESYYDYPEFLKEMELIDKKTGIIVNREITYKYNSPTIEEVQNYRYDCTNKDSINNETGKPEIIQVCEKVEDGIDRINVDNWTPLEKLDLKTGNITIGIFTDVLPGDNIEWYPTLFGVKTTEWAVWTDALNDRLGVYYNMSSVVDIFPGTLNLNNGEAGAPKFTTDNSMCKIDTCMNVTSANNAVTPGNKIYGLRTDNNKTFNVWLYPTSQDNYAFFYNSGTARWYMYLNSGTNTLEMGNLNGGGSAYTTTMTVPPNTYTMITIANNGSNFLFYKNGAYQEKSNLGSPVEPSDALDIGFRTTAGAGVTGYYEELSFWNRTLTNAEITDLYNGGSGLTYKPSGSSNTMSAIVSYPENGTNSSSRTVSFGCNFTAGGDNNITSVKLNITDNANALDYTNTESSLNKDSYNKTWSAALSKDDVFNYTCTAYGSQGINASAFGSDLEVDTTAPFLRIDYPANATSYGYNVTQLNYTCYDNFPANQRPAWYSRDLGLTNQTLVDCATNMSGVNSTEGTNIWMLAANDTNGNLNISWVSFFQDSVYPQIVYNDSGMVAAGGYAQLNYVFINTTWTEINFKNITFDIRSGLSTWSQTFTTATYNYTLPGVTDGLYIFNVTICDLYEHCNMTVTRNLTLDTVAPNVQIVYPVNGTTYNYNVSQLNYTVSDTNPLTATCIYTINGGAGTPVVTGVNVSGITTLEGMNNFSVQCSDDAGNTNVSNVTFFIDTAPNVTLTSPANGYATLDSIVYLNCTANSGEKSIANISLWTNQTGAWTINKTKTVMWYNLTSVTKNSIPDVDTKFINIENHTVINMSNRAVGAAGTQISVIYEYQDGTSSGFVGGYALGGAEATYYYTNPNPTKTVSYIHVDINGGAVTESDDRVWATQQNLNSPLSTNVTLNDTITAPMEWSCSACNENEICGYATENRTILTDTVPPNVSIAFPTTSFITITVGATYGLNYTVRDANLEACWYNYNDINTTVNCALNSSFVYVLGNNTITLYANDTFGNVNSTNVTWTSSYTEYNQIWNATSYETAHETFYINASGFTIADLIYDGTNYFGNVAGNIATKSFDIPTSIGNKSFYWKFDNGTGNSSVRYQNVLPAQFTFCNTTITDRLLNFTFKNETLAGEKTSATFSSSFIYYLGGGTINKTYSFTNASENYEYDFCVSPNTTYHIDSAITYQNSESPLRTYNPSVSSINLGTNVTLYTLPSSIGLYVSFQVVNVAGQPITTATVNATYLGALIEQKPVDGAGIATMFLNPNFAYTICAVAPSYPMSCASITPTQTSYTITLGAGGNALAATVVDYQKGIKTNIYPRAGTLSNNTLYNFTMVINSSYWVLNGFGLNMTNNSGYVLGSAVGTGGAGGTVTLLNFDTGTNKTIVLHPWWIVNGTMIYSNSILYVIRDETGGQFAITALNTRIRSYIDSSGGLYGIDQFTLNIIIFVIILFITGIFSYRFGLTSQATIIGIATVLVFVFEELGLFYFKPSTFLNLIIPGFSHTASAIMAVLFGIFFYREVTGY